MKAQDLRKKSLKDLHQLLAERREKLRELRFLLASGKVKNIREIRETKRTIARILTVINEKQKTEK